MKFILYLVFESTKEGNLLTLVEFNTLLTNTFVEQPHQLKTVISCILGLADDRNREFTSEFQNWSSYITLHEKGLKTP